MIPPFIKTIITFIIIYLCCQILLFCLCKFSGLSFNKWKLNASLLVVFTQILITFVCGNHVILWIITGIIIYAHVLEALKYTTGNPVYNNYKEEYNKVLREGKVKTKYEDY